jgi:hypothetical protein
MAAHHDIGNKYFPAVKNTPKFATDRRKGSAELLLDKYHCRRRGTVVVSGKYNHLQQQST